MARPKKQNADYFPHDKGMRNERKIKAVRNRFGLTGYAVYSMILEVITDCEGFVVVIDSVEMELLAGDFDIDSSLLQEIINYFLKLDIIQDLGDDRYTCEKLVYDLTPLLKKREEMRRKRNKPKEEKKELSGIVEEQTPPEEGLCDTNGICAPQTPHSIVKYSIGEYSIEENNNNSLSPREENGNSSSLKSSCSKKEKSSAKKEKKNPTETPGVKEYSPEAAADEITDYYRRQPHAKRAIMERASFREEGKMTFESEIYALCCHHADNPYWKGKYMNLLSKEVPIWLKRASEYSKTKRRKPSSRGKGRSRSALANVKNDFSGPLPEHYK